MSQPTSPGFMIIAPDRPLNAVNPWHGRSRGTVVIDLPGLERYVQSGGFDKPASKRLTPLVASDDFFDKQIYSQHLSPFAVSDPFEKTPSRPLSPISTLSIGDAEESDGPLLQLTDQTKLLPFNKLLPVFLGLALCCVISAFDFAIVATILPTISESFNAGSMASWVPTAYMLSSTCFQPLYGRFSDIFGRKLALCTAVAIYIVGSLAAGFSTSIMQLIIFRGIAGAGGGSIQSMSQIIVGDIVTLRERGKYQGIISSAISLGYALGPVVGGALVQKVSWRWCFWVILPVALSAICVVFFLLPLKPVKGNMKQKLMAIDYLGTLLTILGSILVLLPLSWGGVTFPWTSSIILETLFFGFTLILMFCLWELKCARLPIIPMYIFKNLSVVGVNIGMFISGFVFFSSLYYLPHFFQVALGYSPIQSGLFLLPMLVTQPISNSVTGYIVSRTGKYKASIYIGFAVWAVGCGCLATVKLSTSKALLVTYMILCGVGGGKTLQTNIIAAQASVSRQDMSVVTALINFVRLLGGTFAQAVGFAVINNCLRKNLSSLGLSSSTIKAIIDKPEILGPNTPESTLEELGLTYSITGYVLTHGYSAGFHQVFILNACLAVVAAIVSYFMIGEKVLAKTGDEKSKEESMTKFGERGQKNGWRRMV